MSVQPWMRPYLTGKCFDFALALAERVDDPVFVAVGCERFPDHVALKIGDRYADVRGVMDEADFLAHHAGSPIVEVDRSLPEFHCGLSDVEPPYRGSADMQAARRVVDRCFEAGYLSEELLNPVPTVAP